MARTSPAEFFRQVRQEVSRVTWPTRKELTITTAMVFVMAFVVAILGPLDVYPAAYPETPTASVALTK